jgi:hypothetical protein
MDRTLLDEPGTAAVFRDLFLRLYGLGEPLVALERIMHWNATIRRLGASVPALDGATTWISGGYFYGTISPSPTESSVAEALDAGGRRGAEAYLVPAVRRAGARPLAHAGFAPIPWFIECVYEMRASLDADLRAQLGSSRYGGLQRIVKKAERDYETEFHSSEDARREPAILDTVAALHECNVRKYGHALNFYSRELLERMMASELGDKLYFCIRRDRETREAVQTFIFLLDRQRSEMYNLVQGIDRDKVRPGQNLYVDTTYRVLRYGAEAGVRMINLGRGAQLQKLHLGANRFYVLDNWVRNGRPSAAAEVASLSEGTRAALGLDAEGRGFVGEFSLE